MIYLKTFFIRAKNALCTMPFWIEFLVVLPLSCLGIWWPWYFNWRGAEVFLNPGPWFTFGVATLMIIVAQRFFMKEEDDKFLMENKLVLFIPSFIAAILYGRSMQDLIHFNSAAGETFDYLKTQIAIYITLGVWFVNYVHVGKFDKTSILAPLGGER